MLFVVDASGSMGARQRMGAVKGAVLSLLLDAYQRRDKVGLVTFRGAARRAGAAADLVGRGRRGAGCESLPTGGRTPLAAGLLQAARGAAGRADARPARRPLLVVVTDGRATGGAGAVRAGRARPPAGSLQQGIAARRRRLRDRAAVRLGLAGRAAPRDLGAEYAATRGTSPPATLVPHGHRSGGRPDAAGTADASSRTTG